MKDVVADFENEQSLDELKEIKLKITNNTDEDIYDVAILSPVGTNEGITIKSLVQGMGYEDLLGALTNMKLEVMISTHFAAGDKAIVHMPFRLHTLNVNGKYSGTQVAPSNPENEASWLSPVALPWGGKNKFTHIIYQCIPANTSFILIISVVPEKPEIMAPEECTKGFCHLEEKVTYKKKMMTQEEVIYSLRTDKPSKIYSTKYSGEDPFFMVESYDVDGLSLYCAAWVSKEPTYLDWKTFFKFAKAEGLKNLAY